MISQAIRILFQILFEAVTVRGVYFGKSLPSVPDGALVIFPYDPYRLGCGITALLAYKRPKEMSASPTAETLRAQLAKLKQFAWEKLSQDGLAHDLHYLGGKESLAQMKTLCDQLKGQNAFKDIFLNPSAKESLKSLASDIREFIGDQDNVRVKSKGRVEPEAYAIMADRIAALRDIYWVLQEEVLANIEKVARLGRFDDHELGPNGKSPNSISAIGRIQEVNTVLNNLDRLEVRGRDSAGISVSLVVDASEFSSFVLGLKAAQLADEFGARQGKAVLLSAGITTRKIGEQVSITFVYKVAAEIGRLGDNVSNLRQQIRNDSIFQSAIRLVHIWHSTLAHTRWASIGAITEANCHPIDGDSESALGVVHVCLNGDIDNYQAIRRDFENETGRALPAEITTDTKVIPVQIEKHLRSGKPLEEAFRLAVSDFEGSHAICMHSDQAPGKVFLAQRGSGQAIFVGLAQEEYIVGSEIYGVVEKTDTFLKMDGEKAVTGASGQQTQGQIFVLNQNSEGGLAGIKAFYYDGTPIQLSKKDVKTTEITSRDIDRQGYPHYFLKEISESPRSVEQTIQGRLAVIEVNGRKRPEIHLDESVIPARLESALKNNKIRRIIFMGQGTAAVAGSVCTSLLREYLAPINIRVASFKASEFSGFMMDGKLEDTLVIAITQSGSTTDTNRAVDMAKSKHAYTMAIVNRRDSDITFKVDGVLYTSSGRDIEMSVASTKAYYSQIVAGSLLGLRFAQITGARDEEFILSGIEQLWRLPGCMESVLEKREEIGASARKFAPTKTYWAVVGSGPNKASADEIRIKLSELCYKTISSDVVEDKKHIDLSAEPLIFVCASGSREDVIGDIVKDVAIFKAHKAVPIVVANEGEPRFDAYADAVIHVPQVQERLAPIINTLTGHLWGYYAALAINDESRQLFDLREDLQQHVSTATNEGLDVYEILLDESFRERAAKFYRIYKDRIQQGRYATAAVLRPASDLTLLLKYLTGRLPSSDFEGDFGAKGTAPNMLERFFECLGSLISQMARPVDAIKHQAKTVTVGTSRIAEKVGGVLFDTLGIHGFDKSQLNTLNVLVLRRLQEVISEIQGTTVYKISGLNMLGEPVEESTIELVKKEGSSVGITSRVETDRRLRGTKRIIVKNGNVFIGKGRRDNRSILTIPIMSAGTTIDYLLLFNVKFQESVALQKKIEALGGKYQHLRSIVEETLGWRDEYLALVPIDDLFGWSAEKVAEQIIQQAKKNS